MSARLLLEPGDDRSTDGVGLLHDKCVAGVRNFDERDPVAAVMISSTAFRLVYAVMASRRD